MGRHALAPGQATVGALSVKPCCAKHLRVPGSAPVTRHEDRSLQVDADNVQEPDRHRPQEMLRITAENGSDHFGLKLEGTLTAAWVREADSYWRAAVANQTGRPLVVDLTDVLSVDDAGRELLTRMHEAGARFVVRGCVMRELVREVTS